MSEIVSTIEGQISSIQSVEQIRLQVPNNNNVDLTEESLPSFSFYDQNSKLTQYMLTLEKDRLVAAALNAAENHANSYGTVLALTRFEPVTSRAKVRTIESILKPLDQAFRTHDRVSWIALRDNLNRQAIEVEQTSSDTVASIEYCIVSIMEYCKAVKDRCSCHDDDIDGAGTLVRDLQRRHVELLELYPDTAVLGELMAYWHTKFDLGWQADTLEIYRSVMDTNELSTYWEAVRSDYINHLSENSCSNRVCRSSLSLIVAGLFTGNEVSLSETCLGRLIDVDQCIDVLEELDFHNLRDHAEVLARQAIAKFSADSTDVFRMFIVEQHEKSGDLEGAADMLLHAFSEDPTYDWYVELRDFCLVCHPAELAWSSWREKLMESLEQSIQKEEVRTSKKFLTLNSIKVRIFADERRDLDAWIEAEKGCELYALKVLAKQETGAPFEQVLKVIFSSVERYLASKTDLAVISDVFQIAYHVAVSKEQRQEFRKQLRVLRERHRLKGQKAAALFRQFGI